jgi:hypothetical protein
MEVPELAWSEFSPKFQSAWEPNDKGRAQHVTVVGPNGQGKSTLCKVLLLERVRLRDSSVVAIGTKPKDETLSSFGWPIIREWPPGYGQYQVIYWPKYGDPRTVDRRQREAFIPVLAEIFTDGNRIVYLDEVARLSEDLNLDKQLRKFWQDGRANNVIVVAGTQRPVNVPRPMWSECSWFFAFRTRDRDELRRVSEIGGGTDTSAVADAIQALGPNEFICVQTRTGEMVRSKVEL